MPSDTQISIKWLAVAGASAAALLMAGALHAEMLDTRAATTPPVTTATPPNTNPVCGGPAEVARLNQPLTRTARRLASGEPLTIVAIGSSSTAGAGASSPAASYPSRLAAELQRRFPGHDITVLNRGINGDETWQMLARFPKDVFAAHPDLVIWQVGVNSVLRDRPLQPHSELLRDGIAQIRDIGADVVLIDMQYTPKVIAKSETPDMEHQIAYTAKLENVDLFARFALMRDWSEVRHIPFETFTAPDQLHMNDWGYACVAKLLATAIGDAATRPVASAAARPQH
jgi:lysophospholipase L1-like esterase